MRCRLFVYLLVERDEALSAALGAHLNTSRERIKEQPRALRHAPLTNIQKSLQRIFATLYFVRSFFEHSFLQRFILRAVFLTICVDFDYVFL